MLRSDAPARWQAASTAAALAAGAWLLARFAAGVPVLANDDTFVYFNYARNFALGRPFAYDPRGIPSEGFTSWLHLFALVPCELAGVNPMLAAVALNLAALAGAALLVARAHARLAGGASPWSGVAGVAFLALAVGDADLPGMIGWGLESVVNGAALLALVGSAHACALAGARPEDLRRRARGFLALGFAALLVRPENAAILAALGVALAARAPLRRALLSASPFLLVPLALWLAAKLWLFGALLPTAWYRKVEPSAPAALAYVGGFLRESGVRGIAALALVALPWLPSARAWRPLRAYLALLALAVAVSLAVFLNVNPLVGQSHRFLVLPVLALHVVPALALAWWLCARGRESAASAGSRGPREAASALVTLGAALVVGLGSAPPALPGSLAQRADRAMREHPYLVLGHALREALPQPEQLVVVFGDAGGLPYALGSAFVDPNGLSEPPIARLFALGDEAEKRRRFEAYVLGQRPDLVVIGYGAPDAAGRLELRSNRHSPFREPSLDFPRALVRAGFRYACSARAVADLHFGASASSPHFAALAPALARLCARPEAYRLPGGLVLELGGESVRFEPLRLPPPPPAHSP